MIQPRNNIKQLRYNTTEVHVRGYSFESGSLDVEAISVMDAGQKSYLIRVRPVDCWQKL
jgi:hypothetical protein